MIYLYKGDLPYYGIQEQNQKEWYRLIMETKMMLSIEELCSDMPVCFNKYLTYVRDLDFDKTPNYKLELDWCIRKIE
jgi:hypothetical protein